MNILKVTIKVDRGASTIPLGDRTNKLTLTKERQGENKNKRKDTTVRIARYDKALMTGNLVTTTGSNLESRIIKIFSAAW